MNTAVATRTEPRPPINAGGAVSALIPQNLEEAFRVASAFAASGLAPQSLKGPEAILVAIMAGAELGFAPYQAMQSFAVINGRASIWGDAIPALLWSKGFDLEEWWDSEDEPTRATCRVTRPSGKVIERTFTLADAKKAGLIGKTGPWQTATKRMLLMRARAFAARDGAADVLRGMAVYEEVQDFTPIRENAPRPAGLAARLAAPREAATEGFNVHHAEPDAVASFSERLNDVLEGDDIPAHDADTGEVREDLPAAEHQAATAENGEAIASSPSGDAPPHAADDSFPGDKPNSRDAGAPNKPPADISGACQFEDSAEFASVLPAYIEAVETADALATLWADYQADLKRLQLDNPVGFAEAVKAKNARKAEIARAEAKSNG
jgi:hypothetical protein